MKLLALSISLIALLFTSCDQARQSNNADTSLPRPPTNQNRPANCVNLNKASAEELKALPEVGEIMAQKIIEHRNRHGKFRRPQELIIIEGFSEKKYRAIADLICVE